MGFFIGKINFSSLGSNLYVPFLFSWVGPLCCFSFSLGQTYM